MLVKKIIITMNDKELEELRSFIIPEAFGLPENKMISKYPNLETFLQKILQTTEDIILSKGETW